MTPHEAAKILDLPVDATPELIEPRFNELRAKLEDKVAKAPTPGLKAKYRESLEEITTAFETLTLAADASSLPVLQRQRTEAGGQKTVPKPVPVPAARETQPKPVTKKSGGWEFLVVAVIALAALGAGGWWVMKTRADNETKARLAAEQKAEAEHQAQLAHEKAEQDRLAKEAADKAEKERGEKLFTSLRTRMAELNVAYEALMRAEQSAERELTELKSQERDLAREQKAAPTPELRRLSAQVRAQDRLAGWLRDTLPTHPARIARAKADELLSARATDQAAAAVTAYAEAIDLLKKDIAAARTDLAVTGTLQLSANLDGATWQLTDAFGVERSGAAPAQLDDVALGKGALTFRRAGWPDQRYTVDLRPGGTTAAGQFPIGSLRVTSEPAGAQVFRGDKVLGTTPLEIAQLPPSQMEVRFALRKFRSQKLAGKIEDGKTLLLAATLEPGKAADLEMVLDALAVEVAAVPDPKDRASQILPVLMLLRQLQGAPKPAVRRLMELHLEACKAIPDPKQRLDTISFAIQTVLPSIDYDYAREWGEVALACYPGIRTSADRQQALITGANFMIYPDIEARIAAAMRDWFPSDDWVYGGMVAQRFAEAGAEAEAQRAVERAANGRNEYEAKAIRDYLGQGRQMRKFVPVAVALVKGDLAAARRELAGYTGTLDYGQFATYAAEFIRLGDADSAMQLGRMAQTEYLKAPMTDSMLVSLALMAGNTALAERWAVNLVDTSESATRSQAYLGMARIYMQNGRKAEALRAVNQVTSFPTAVYAGDRYESALILAELGETNRALNLVRGQAPAFSKEESVKLWYAAGLFAILNDTTSAERALQAIQRDNPEYLDAALGMVVQALCNVGRYDDANTYQARLNNKNVVGAAQYARALIRVNQAQEDDLGFLIDQAASPAERFATLYAVLNRIREHQVQAH